MRKITIIGNLGKKPEERVTKNGMDFVSFSVAVRISKEKSQWYEIAIWKDKIKNFSNILCYLDKGSKICVVGDLAPPQIYQSRDGEMKVRLLISADSLNFVGGDQDKPKEPSPNSADAHQE